MAVVALLLPTAPVRKTICLLLLSSGLEVSHPRTRAIRHQQRRGWSTVCTERLWRVRRGFTNKADTDAPLAFASHATGASNECIL